MSAAGSNQREYVDAVEATAELEERSKVRHRHACVRPEKTVPDAKFRGEQYRDIRSTERFAEAESVAMVGSNGDSYANAMAEALNSLFKAECIHNPVMRPRGGLKSISDVEFAVAE